MGMVGMGWQSDLMIFSNLNDSMIVCERQLLSGLGTGSILHFFQLSAGEKAPCLLYEAGFTPILHVMIQAAVITW